MNLRNLAIALGLLALFAAPAQADTFASPKVGGKLMDWCQTWQQGCGKAAAETFCKKQGFSGAASFQKAEDVGNTRTIGDNSVCEDGNCDGFAQITCKPILILNPGLIPMLPYLNPEYKGIRLDYCRNWQKNCGKPAADAFCKAQGKSSAAAFTKSGNLPKTRVIGTSQVCESGSCQGFTQIACK